MKKFCLTFLFVCAAFGVYAQNNIYGVIREMNGSVEIKLPGAASFVEAKVGDQITQDTVISTAFRSFATIEIGHTLIIVRPVTHLTLTELQASADSETLNVNLQSGAVRVDVKPPAGTRSDTSVSGPMVTASVRGTTFEFDTCNIYVREGVVSYAGSRGKAINVGAGGRSRVEADATVAIPIDVRMEGVLPPAPVGSNIAGIIPSGPARLGVAFTINLEFNRP